MAGTDTMPRNGSTRSIELRDEEVRMLQQVLLSYLSDLRMEIRGTDHRDFREELKAQQEFLNDFIQRLDASV